MGWVFAAAVASLALLSLGATATVQHDMTDAMANQPPLQAGEPDVSALANAYFQIAREAPGLSAGEDGWFVRHEITLKGLSAQRGENPSPEEPEKHKLQPTDEPELTQAGRLVEDWRARLLSRSYPEAFNALTARLQVQYDWWLLLAEAGASRQSLQIARRMYDDARAALSQAAAQNKLAAL